MNKELRIPDYLEHILLAIEAIEEYTQNMDEPLFLGNRMVQDAVIRNLEVIGEAAKNIEKADANFVSTHGHIPWAKIYAMRNRIAHGYFSINLGVVWTTIEIELPELKKQISEL